MDSKTTIEDLKQTIKRFMDERNWEQFHNPKDLAIGISTEANELLDIFRFKNEQQVKEIMSGKERKHVAQELSDTLVFILRFAQLNGLDIATELHKKMKINAQKYPVEASKNKNDKSKFKVQ